MKNKKMYIVNGGYAGERNHEEILPPTEVIEQPAIDEQGENTLLPADYFPREEAKDE